MIDTQTFKHFYSVILIIRIVVYKWMCMRALSAPASGLCVYVCVFLRTQQRPASRVSLIKILMASQLHANGSNGKAKRERERDKESKRDRNNSKLDSC